MTPVNLGDLPTNSPVPLGTCQLKRGAVDGQVNYTSANADGTVILDGAGAPMQIQVTPAVNSWWLIRAEMIWSSPDAAWSYQQVRIDLTPADLDGFSKDYAMLPIHSALSWQDVNIHTAYRIAANTLYTARLCWVTSNAYNHYMWTGKDYTYISGELIAEGSF